MKKRPPYERKTCPICKAKLIKEQVLKKFEITYKCPKCGYVKTEWKD
jgi:predicted RNA-binding Zn-ribbon protein involved in translation (DUF1610 family)